MVAFLLVLFFIRVTDQAATTIHVTADPVSFGDGTALRPFDNVRDASQHVRTLRAGGNDEEIVVLLSHGTHDGFSLGAKDSGVPGGHTIYRGGGPQTIVSGGMEVPPTLFKKNTDLTSAAGATNGTWTLQISSKGSGYAHPTVLCNGTSNSKFRIRAVTTGGPEDPRKGLCKRWHIDTQFILEISNDGGAAYSLAPSWVDFPDGTHDLTFTPPGTLACGNAGEAIASAQFQSDTPVSVYTANLSSLHINATDLGSIVAAGCIHGCAQMPSGLSWGSERMWLARWPNINSATGYNSYHNAAKGCGPGCFNVARNRQTERMSAWAQEDSGWIHGYFEWDWADCYRAIANVTVMGDQLQVKMDPASESPKPNARFYGLNLLSELDAPGEYFLDQTKQLLHVVPPTTITGGPDAWASGPVISLKSAVVNISGTSNVKVENMQILNGRGVGLMADTVSGVSLNQLTVQHHGQQGIYVTNASDSQINHNTVSLTGCAAIRAHGGFAPSLTPGNLEVRGNTVSLFALWKVTYNAGIHWAGVGNVYADNVVSKGPHNCFLGGGNEADASTTVAGVDNVFDNNTLHTCAFEAADTGAFYVCGQEATAFVNRNNSITNSLFAHVRNTVGTGVQGPSVQAIYLDDQMSGWRIENNHFTDCQTGSFIGGGRRNIVRGNVYTHCDTAQHLDNRGMNWQKASADCTTVNEPLHGTCNPGGAAWMTTLAPAAAAWSKRFPEMVQMHKQKIPLGPPVLNQITGNKYCKCGKFIDASSKDSQAWMTTVENNTEYTDC